MDGLIILQPFATLIITGGKKWENRKYKPPADKISKPIYLLSEKKILGEIAIDSCRYNQIKHNYIWSIQVLKKYSKPKSYNHKNGSQIWVKDIEIG